MPHSATTRRITISLPEELIVFADAKATETGTSRSGVISESLAQRLRRERDELAREGYRFFAEESEEFAESSAAAVAEALDGDRSAR